MSKKQNTIVLLLVLLCLTSVVASYAFVTRTISSDNVITFGDVKIKIQEFQSDKGFFSASKDKPADILEFSNMDKVICIKNEGSVPAFVRVSLSVFEITTGERVVASEDLVTIDVSSDDWVYSNGWFYYKKPLMVGEKTSVLSANLSFNENKITAQHKTSLFELSVNAQSVQSTNNCEDVLDAVGWPEEGKYVK